MKFTPWRMTFILMIVMLLAALFSHYVVLEKPEFDVKPNIELKH